jgi:hypothetical protein
MVVGNKCSASLMFVEFLQKYTLSMTKQIQAVQAQLEESSSGVMTALQELAASTESKKKDAERVLDTTYFNPDASTTAMVDSIQRSADDIFEQASAAVAKGSDTSAAVASKNASDVVDRGADIRRVGGLFSKHMESVSTMDDSVKDIVMSMVGCMSNADVVKQRIDHVTLSLTGLDLGIANILLDLDGRLNPAAIAEFKSNLLDYVYKSYSTEQERTIFKEIFGAAPSVLKAYAESGRKAN